MDIPGSGAAGGLGGGLMLQMLLLFRIDKVLNIMDIDIHLKDRPSDYQGRKSMDSLYWEGACWSSKRAKKYDIQ